MSIIIIGVAIFLKIVSLMLILSFKPDGLKILGKLVCRKNKETDISTFKA
jgi:hypothetical protein